MNSLNMRGVIAIFTCCLIFLQQTGITDANRVRAFAGDSYWRPTNTMSGRTLVNLQRSIRNNPNFMENDYQQQQFDIGAITYDEEPFAEPTTSATDVDDLSDVAAILERDQSFDNTAADEESSTIQTPVSVSSAAAGIRSDSLAQELATIPPLPLDDDFQDVYSTSATDESITLMSDVLQDFTTIAPVFEAISSTGDLSVDPEIVTLPYSTVADILEETTTHEMLIDDEEMALLSSNPITDPLPASDDLPAAAITFVPTASSADDLSLITPATAMTDVLTEIPEIPTQIQQLEYSSFGPNEEEGEGEEDGDNIISLMAVKHLPDELTRAKKDHDEPHQSVPYSADEEAYPVSGPSSKETVIMTATASDQPLTNNIGENPPLATTEASAPTHHQSTLTDDEPSSDPILDFPLFYPSRIAGTVPPAVSVPDPLPALNPVSLRWPSAIVATTSESFPAADDEADDQQLLTHDERGQPELEQNKRPQFYTSRPAYNKFKSSVDQDYPEVPNTFYHHPFSPSVVQPINQQSRYRQQQQASPPRAPYPHPQKQHENKGDDSPFYRPFDSAPPKPRRLIFPPISNTRENFRFRVNWSDELGRSDWA